MCRLFLVILCACFSFPAVAMNYKTPVERLITDYIRPVTAEFAIAAAKLPAAAANVCLDPNAATNAAFQKAYAETIKDFAAVHFLRFGPLLDLDRVSRLAFMPDPRGVAMRQIRKILAGKNPTVLSIESLKNKSVAVQGLTALQLIAYDKTGVLGLGQESDTREFICDYALAISENISEMAQEVAAEWANPSGFSALLLTVNSDNPRFQSEKEVLEFVFNVLATGITVARDQNLLPTLGTSEKKAKPNRLPFSRSGNGVLFLSSELKGLQRALDSMQLKSMVSFEHAWLFDTVNFEFRNAQDLLTKLQPPIRRTFYDTDSYSKLAVLAIILQSLRELIAPEIAGALGLSGGFNALDGD